MCLYTYIYIYVCVCVCIDSFEGAGPNLKELQMAKAGTI